ncbi:MAG: helix-turn-helix transcriptional regulator, partial [Pseudonocardia sp.]|nr:helix-turn-helix transcriptional regulator [Pseudonocardia sp.]
MRHAASDGVASAGGDAEPGAVVVPAAAGPAALVLLGGVPRVDEHPPPAVPEVVSALRAAAWDHVVVDGRRARARAGSPRVPGGRAASPASNTSAQAASGAFNNNNNKSVPVANVGGRESTLSVREVQVLALAADGLSNPEIGRGLGLSSLTVKSYLGRMT